MQVSLNVYDVTNTTNDNTNGMITRLNSITRELNFGGVFHGAVQLEELEWSFGYCENGTGVYCCHARSNGMYTFREHIELGVTNKTKQEIKEILTRFKRAWPGTSYDLLQRNCCHFCEELCAALEVPSPPAWLNRFAQGADATVKFTNEASALAKRVGTNLSLTAQSSASWLKDMSQRLLAQIAQPPTSDSDSDVAGSSFSPNSNSAEQSWRSEPAGTSRLGGRGRLFSAGPSAASCSNLPSSTHASSSDLPSLQQGTHQGAASSQGLSFPSALRQKWQELEASAGDGTKQFLFGLIKTRQARLEDEDPAMYGSVIERSDDASEAGAFPTARPSCSAAEVPSTQPPLPQVIRHSLLPPDALGLDTATEAASAQRQSAAGAEAGSASSTTSSSAPAWGSAAAPNGPPGSTRHQQETVHLLDL